MLDTSALPKSFDLKGGRHITISTIKDSDDAAVLAFLANLPEEERDYLWDDPNDPALVKGWTQPVSANKVIPLAVWENDKIVSVWTLGFGDHNWTRHRGYIWGIVDPELRRFGVGSIVVKEMLAMASQLEMEKVVIELVRQQKGPISHFTNIGFSTAAVLKDWVKDRAGRYHDLVVLTMEIEPAWRKMEEMLSRYESYGSN